MAGRLRVCEHCQAGPEVVARSVRDSLERIVIDEKYLLMIFENYVLISSFYVSSIFRTLLAGAVQSSSSRERIIISSVTEALWSSVTLHLNPNTSV